MVINLACIQRRIVIPIHRKMYFTENALVRT